MLVIQSLFLLRSLTLSTASPSCHLQETRQIDSEGMTAKLCVFEDTGTSWMSDACPQTLTQIAASRRSVFVSRDALPLSSGWHALLMRVFLDFPIKGMNVWMYPRLVASFHPSLSMFACISPKKDDSEVVAS